jgi:hypothetical protein
MPNKIEIDIAHGSDIDECKARFSGPPTKEDFEAAKARLRSFNRDDCTISWYGEPVLEDDGWWSLGESIPM